MRVCDWPLATTFLTSGCLAALAAPLGAQEANTQLDLIVVTDQAERAIPGTSRIDAAALGVRNAGDLDHALRSQPGTYSRAALDNPGISVNIRGLQGLGRVNAMIDGVQINTRNLSGHAGGFGTQLYVDPGLLAGVDVTRGTPSGAAGTGTLGGAANFRTLDLDDVLAEGRGAGGLFRFGAGSNGKDWSGTLAGAQRVDTGQGRLGLLGAISGLQERPYKDGNGAPGTLTKGQQPLSYLLKAEYEAAGFGRLKFTASSYHNLFTPAVSSGYVWDVDQKIFALNYSRDDLRLNLSRVKSVIAQPDNAAGTGGVYAGREGVNTGTAFDLSDSAHLDFGGRPLTLSYGLAWNRDAFDGNAAAGGNADGTLTKSGLFVDARHEVGRLAVTGGLRYDHWKTEGVTDYLADGTPVALDARSGGKLNPSLRFDYQATPALNLHAAVSGSMRPPTASEMFYPGAVFAHSDISSTAINNNPNLNPEEAVNAEIGLAWGSGPFSVAAALFQSRIDNYVTYGPDTDGMLRWVNLDGTTTMKGLELEARYDTGRFYTGFALTLADTDRPMGPYNGYLADAAGLPDDYATLDIGYRWMDRTLSTGARLRYTGASETFGFSAVPTAIPAHTLLDLYASWQVSANFDLYANIENVTDRFYLSPNAVFAEAESNLGGRGRTITLGGSLRF